MLTIRRRGRWAWAPLLLGLVACGGEPADPAERVVAFVDDRPILLAELEAYIRLHLFPGADNGGEEAAAGAELDRVQSRLLDALVDERLLLAEAERRDLAVDEREVEVYLGLDADDDPADDAAAAEARRELARQHLLVQALIEREVERLPPLTEEEVRERQSAARERSAGGRRLVVRALSLDSADQAAGVYADIRRRRLSFDEAVAAHRARPDEGVPMEVAWDNLPEEIRRVLEGLAAGAVAEPLDFRGEHYLFRLDAWLDAPQGAEDASSGLERAREELERERRQGVWDDLVAQLRKSSRVTLWRRNLPFRYVSERS